jgi:transposase
VAESAQPSYEQLAAQVASQARLLSEQAALIETLQAEVVALKRRLGRDSSNSSQPPSKDSPAAKAKAKVKARAQTVADKTGADTNAGRREQGGQPGHPGSGLARVRTPNAVKALEPPSCGGCGGGLAGAPGRIASSVQVFDLPTFAVQVTEYLLMARTCGCGHVSTAVLPAGVRGGPTCYGPNIAAAASLLASCDVIGIERTAQLMSDLLGVVISTGFVSSCLARLDGALVEAGFEDALKAGLARAEVLGTDETPAALTTGETRKDDCYNPHVFTVRTMRAYTGCPAPAGDLLWYGAAGTRTKTAITDFGLLETFTGILVRDDFGGYTSYDAQLAGVQQCLAHIFRYLDDAHAIDPLSQVWTRQVLDVLREAIHTVKTTRDKGESSLDADYLQELKHRYDQAVAVGISTNLTRPWKDGNHPGLQLANRLKRKKDQMWLFATRFDVPPTNNGSEHAVRGVKLFVKVKGCWRTLATLQRHCRIRSYLTTTANHGIRTIDAIRDALTGTCWMPPTPA